MSRSLLTPNYLTPEKTLEIRRLHEYYSHPSVNEMKRMAGVWFKELEVTPKDIDNWHAREDKFCSGCEEGKIKEHARRASTKPLTVGDLMFIEGRNDVKIPFYLHVDVATNFILGYAMRYKTYGEVVRAIEQVGKYGLLGTSWSALRSTENHQLSLAAQEDIEARE